MWQPIIAACGNGVGSGYLSQRELYRLGLRMTLFFLAVILVVGTASILLVTG